MHTILQFLRRVLKLQRTVVTGLGLTLFYVLGVGLTRLLSKFFSMPLLGKVSASSTWKNLSPELSQNTFPEKMF